MGAVNWRRELVQSPSSQGLVPHSGDDSSQRFREKLRLERELVRQRQQQEEHAQKWIEERDRLQAEIERAKNASAAAAESHPVSLDATALVAEIPSAAVATADVKPASALRPLAAFHNQSCGANLSLSNNSYTATRTRGCRQSVAIGSGPLEHHANGRYFEVVIDETVNGWVGGLGIGVTRSAPDQLKKMPDKAWRLPGTYIVGYWGCIFLDGRERRTKWRSDALTPGQRVGLLVANGTGDLIIFVDGKPVVRAESALRETRPLSPVADGESGCGESWNEGLGDAPLYPVVDVFAAARAVTLARLTTPPPACQAELKELSPPGSPVSVSRRSVGSVKSMNSSALGF